MEFPNPSALRNFCIGMHLDKFNGMDTENLRDEINKRIDGALEGCPVAGVCRGMIRNRMLAYWCEYGVLPELRIEPRPASLSSPHLRAGSDILISPLRNAGAAGLDGGRVSSQRLHSFPLTQSA